MMDFESSSESETDARLARIVETLDAVLAELARLSSERARLDAVNLLQDRQNLELDARLRRAEIATAGIRVSRERSIDQTQSSAGIEYLERAARDPQVALDAQDIARSGLFDVDFYLRKLPKLPRSLAIAHYLKLGFALELDPHPLFSTIFYLEKYPEVREVGRNPLIHFISQPSHHQTDPHLYFDSSYYLRNAPDVANAGEIGLRHYLAWGWREGRDPSPRFSGSRYLAANQDVREAKVNPLEHYLCYGQFEGRRTFEVETAGLISKKAKSKPLRSEQKQPVVSVIVPLYNSEPHWVNECVRSILGQSYGNIELILVDDASPRPLARAYMDSFARADQRVKAVFCTQNGGISRATNAGLAAASGEYVAFVDHDDVLVPDAIESCMRVFDQQAACDVVYTDHQLQSESGQLVETVRKPDWSPVMFMGVMYLAHLVVARMEIVRSAGGLDPRFDGVQDFEFELRLARLTSGFKRVATSAYAWRAVPGSIAGGTDNKPEASARQIVAVQQHLDILGVQGEAVPNLFCGHRVAIVPRDRQEISPKVLFLIDTGINEQVSAALRSDLFKRTSLQNGIIGFSHGPGAIGRGLSDRLPQIVAERSDAEFVAFLPDGIDFTSAHWLATLVLHLSLPSVGAVTAMHVLDGRVARAARAFQRDGTLIDLFSGELPDADGRIGMLSCAREVSLPSLGTVLMRRADLVEVGVEGWGDFTSLVDDVCLKLSQSGRNLVFVPSVRASLRASLPNRSDGSRRALRSLCDTLLVDKWRSLVEGGDPFWPEASD